MAFITSSPLWPDIRPDRTEEGKTVKGGVGGWGSHLSAAYPLLFTYAFYANNLPSASNILKV